MNNINPALLRWRKAEIPYAMIRNATLDILNLTVSNKRKSLRLLKNNDLKNIISGKRCFIIGNGPSLSKQDLSLLRDEFVFTCNSISQKPGFENIRTNVHFWIDPNFFLDDTYVSFMKGVKTGDNNPICFFPVEQHGFVQNYGLDKSLNVRYFYSGYTIYEGYNKQIDFCKMLPLVTTVVMSEIFLAIYMGAKEIYLLGCDCTGAISHIKATESQNTCNFEYAYSMSEKELAARRNAYLNDGNEFFFYLQSKGFQHYRIMNEYCKKRGILLANCSAGGILNEIPFRKFEEVLLKKE